MRAKDKTGEIPCRGRGVKGRPRRAYNKVKVAISRKVFAKNSASHKGRRRW